MKDYIKFSPNVSVGNLLTLLGCVLSILMLITSNKESIKVVEKRIEYNSIRIDDTYRKIESDAKLQSVLYNVDRMDRTLERVAKKLGVEEVL